MANQQEAAGRRNKRESSAGRKFVAAIDFGTTSVRCFLYDPQGRVRSRAAEKIKQLYPHQVLYKI
jgi:glycerol kinase